MWKDGNMGIFKVAASSVSGALADQWLERVEANDMNNNTIATYGVVSRKNDRRNRNKKDPYM